MRRHDGCRRDTVHGRPEARQVAHKRRIHTRWRGGTWLLCEAVLLVVVDGLWCLLRLGSTDHHTRVVLMVMMLVLLRLDVGRGGVEHRGLERLELKVSLVGGCHNDRGRDHSRSQAAARGGDKTGTAAWRGRAALESVVLLLCCVLLLLQSEKEVTVKSCGRRQT